jgi:hypothetical protein
MMPHRPFQKGSIDLYLLGGGSAGLLIASFLPIWTCHGVKRSLWTVAWKTVHSLFEQPDPVFPVTRQGNVQDIGLAAIIFMSGSLVGAIIFFLRPGRSRTQSTDLLRGRRFNLLLVGYVMGFFFLGFIRYEGAGWMFVVLVGFMIYLTVLKTGLDPDPVIWDACRKVALAVLICLVWAMATGLFSEDPTIMSRRH